MNKETWIWWGTRPHWEDGPLLPTVSGGWSHCCCPCWVPCGQGSECLTVQHQGAGGGKLSSTALQWMPLTSTPARTNQGCPEAQELTGLCRVTDLRSKTKKSQDKKLRISPTLQGRHFYQQRNKKTGEQWRDGQRRKHLAEARKAFPLNLASLLSAKCWCLSLLTTQECTLSFTKLQEESRPGSRENSWHIPVRAV